MTEQKKSWLQLSVACLCIILIWGFFLPWLGEQEAIKNHIESMEAKGIDPAAMFYTDIDAMEQIDQDLQEIHTHHPQAFWSVSGSE